MLKMTTNISGVSKPMSCVPLLVNMSHSLRRHAAITGEKTGRTVCAGAAIATGVCGKVFARDTDLTGALRTPPSLRYSPRNCLCRRMEKTPAHSAVLASRQANCANALKGCAERRIALAAKPGGVKCR